MVGLSKEEKHQVRSNQLRQRGEASRLLLFVIMSNISYRCRGNLIIISCTSSNLPDLVNEGSIACNLLDNPITNTFGMLSISDMSMDEIRISSALFFDVHFPAIISNSSKIKIDRVSPLAC